MKSYEWNESHHEDLRNHKSLLFECKPGCDCGKVFKSHHWLHKNYNRFNCTKCLWHRTMLFIPEAYTWEWWENCEQKLINEVLK